MNFKMKIVVCMGSSCFARGNNVNLAVIESFIAKHNVDAEIDLSGSLCEGLCGKGPNIWLNGRLLHSCSGAELEKMLESELIRFRRGECVK